MARLSCWWLMLFFALGCSALHAERAMAADELRTGCSGGITGGGAGLVLTRDGQLWNWQRSRANADLKRGPLLGTDAQAAMQLFEKARLGGFALIQYRHSGNRTCWVELTEDEQTHGVYWTDPGSAPSLALSLFDALQKLQRDLTVTRP
jgi:hypothetical protein